MNLCFGERQGDCFVATAGIFNNINGYLSGATGEKQTACLEFGELRQAASEAVWICGFARPLIIMV